MPISRRIRMRDLPVYVCVGGSGGKGGAVKTIIIFATCRPVAQCLRWVGGESTYKFNGAAGGTV